MIVLLMLKKEKLLYYKNKIQNSNGLEKIKYQIFFDATNISTKHELKEKPETNIINNFSRTFLSNFYPVEIEYSGKKYPSVEHAYQAQKFNVDKLAKLTKGQIEELQELLKLRGHCVKISNIKDIFSDNRFSSGNIKVITEKLQEWHFIRSGRDEMKFDVMINLLMQKWTKNEDLKTRLLSTKGKYLVEGNTRNDIYRGYCNGRGNNFLGRSLMYIRDNVL